MTTQALREAYSQQIRLYIAARVTGPAVDDILQQVFLKVHQKIETLKVKWATKSRLYRITQHTIIDWYRKEYWDKNGTMSNLFWESLEEDTSDIKEKKLAKNISSCILPMISDLDQQSREVMERYLQPESTQLMIAEELWLSVSNVKVIVHRAKWKLKNMYEQCCYQYKDEQGHVIDTWCSSNCGCANSAL